LENFALSYVQASAPFWKRWVVRAIENLSGRRRLLPLYRVWSASAAGNARMMNELLPLIDTHLAIASSAWPPLLPENTPLIMVANHPFGIGDGIAMLALAEQLERPYRVLINTDFLAIPEIRPYALPIDFSGTRQVIETNLETRREARRALKRGETLIVFPAGGVATADRLFGRAEELPWKTFTARLIQDAGASVLPVYFEGQNSLLFHLVSRYSLSLRLALLVSEFRRFVGAEIRVHVGDLVPYSALEARQDRVLLTDELYRLVHRLAPGASELPASALHPTPPAQRRRYPWDAPQKQRRGSPSRIEERIADAS
jgi:putative hemolysin